LVPVPVPVPVKINRKSKPDVLSIVDGIVLDQVLQQHGEFLLGDGAGVDPVSDAPILEVGQQDTPLNLE